MTVLERPIPILDLTQQYEALQPEMNEAIISAAAGGQYINGPNVKAFEKELAAYLGCFQVVGLNSGTDALHLALRALDIGPGDEVITTAFTFVATTEAIGIVGAVPVFVDIDPLTYTLDVKQIEEAITPRTKAILPVHLYGQPADMNALMAIARSRHLYVIEDCAQSIGSTFGSQHTGTIGDIGCFSFFPSKNLGAYGDGGACSTNNPQLAERLASLRAHGAKVKYYHEELGVNSRLDEIQAAILRVKLPHLDNWNQARRAIAQRYREWLADVPGVVLPPEVEDRHCVYHQFTIRIPERDRVQQELQARGIQTMVYYPIPLHKQQVHERLGYAPVSLPETEQATLEVLSLPIFPELTEEQQSQVVHHLREVLIRS